MQLQVLSNLSLISFLLNFIQDHHGITDEVYISLPSVLTSNGVSKIVNQILTDKETEKLQNSAKSMVEIINGLSKL